jgi:glycerol uptake facilitator-like aquaporin
LEAIGRTLIQVEDWGLKIGLAFLALGHLVYAILFISSGAVPLALGWFGVLASVLAAGGILLNIINPNISMAAAVILIPYELVLGIWLLLRGGQLVAP